MSDFFAWLTTSSADPAKVATTVKGTLVTIVPLAVAFLGIDSELANTIVGNIVSLVQAVMTVIGLLMTLYGLLRKVKLGRWSHPNF